MILTDTLNKEETEDPLEILAEAWISEMELRIKSFNNLNNLKLDITFGCDFYYLRFYVKCNEETCGYIREGLISWEQMIEDKITDLRSGWKHLDEEFKNMLLQDNRGSQWYRDSCPDDVCTHVHNFFEDTEELLAMIEYNRFFGFS